MKKSPVPVVSMIFSLIAMTICLLPARTAAKEPDRARLGIGEKAGQFAFTDIHYLPRTLQEFSNKRAYVVVFTTLQCPIVRRYQPRIKELEARYRDQQVQFLALNVGVNDPLVEVAYQSMQADWPFPVGKDFGGSAAKALGVTRTPEVVVLDGDFRLCYRGRIDGKIRFGGNSLAAGREELQEAIDDVLAGRNVALSETPVDGCLIEFDALQSLPRSVPERVTYHEHIAPILASHCQNCHRPGASAPFPLMTAADVKAHAEMIAEVVQQGRMPPNFASREQGPFEKLHRVSSEEQALVRAWVQQGQQEGDPSLSPPPPVIEEAKWKIGEPDLVISTLLETKVPASGILDYQYSILPHVFLHDTWVQRVEILPSNKSVMHHCNMGYLQPGAKISDQNFITGYVPGGDVMILENGTGFCIPAGSVLVLQMHYVTTGEPAVDRTSVGFVFAREVIQKQLRNIYCVAHDFAIPPGDPNYRMTATRTLPHQATGYGLFGHMHLRGKNMLFRATYPDNTQATLLAIPNYDFNWQMAYRWPRGAQKFPQGTQLEVSAHFDNSEFNPFNPDAAATVTEGDQSYDEMMYGFLFYTDDNEQLNLTINPKTGRVVK